MSQLYVLISASRNEELNIEKTIQSVIAQTITPRKWVIVSDGSTDRTDEIANHYASNYEFIHVVHREYSGDRNFASKVFAINQGLEHIKGIAYDFIGILDADVSFYPDYYERIFEKFDKNPALGIAGGIVFTLKGSRKFRSTTDLNHVAGAVQTFRRKCFEDIKGYIPVPIGGIDKIAETMARMKGWETTSFHGIEIVHYQEAGTKVNNVFGARYQQGVRDYLTGYHPVYFTIRSFYRFFKKPYIIGGFLNLVGFYSTMLSGKKRAVSKEFVEFLRREQLQKLFSYSKQCWDRAWL